MRSSVCGREGEERRLRERGSWKQGAPPRRAAPRGGVGTRLLDDEVVVAAAQAAVAGEDGEENLERWRAYPTSERQSRRRKAAAVLGRVQDSSHGACRRPVSGAGAGAAREGGEQQKARRREGNVPT
jgi:hypothetical protein